MILKNSMKILPFQQHMTFMQTYVLDLNNKFTEREEGK